MLKRYLVPPLSAIYLIVTATSSSAIDDDNVVGPPGFDEKLVTPEAPQPPSSPPNPCVTFENWDVGSNAIPERVFISDTGNNAILKYITSDEHQVYQFSAGVRVKEGEHYRFTGLVSAGDESDVDFRVFFERATAMRTGKPFDKKLKPGRSLTINEDIRATAEHLDLYVWTKPSSPRDVHISVSDLKLCHVK